MQPPGGSPSASRVSKTPAFLTLTPQESNTDISGAFSVAAALPDGLSAEQLRRSLEGIPSTLQGEHFSARLASLLLKCGWPIALCRRRDRC